MYCKRCGALTDGAETCHPRCLSSKAYLRLIPYCGLCGKQQCVCSARPIITTQRSIEAQRPDHRFYATISGGCK